MDNHIREEVVDVVAIRNSWRKIFKFRFEDACLENETMPQPLKKQIWEKIKQTIDIQNKHVDEKKRIINQPSLN